MALYAFDGTWNEAKDNEDPQYTNTNVFRFYKAYQKHSNTNDRYVPGVGTRYDVLGRVFGGAFGLGELPRINETYDDLCQNWADGDHVVDIVGFSRGAATTLDFCHCVQARGIRKPGTDDVVEPKPTIRFLGVWDIVAAFGLANLGAVEFNIGHHLTLPKSNLQYCFHAMAIDERRPSFLPTRLNGAYEVWFRGVHSDIGGGNTNRGLNDIALRWMFRKAKASGLPIIEEDIAALQPDPSAPPHPAKDLPLPIRLISPADRRHYTVSPLDGFVTPPDTCVVETADGEQTSTELGSQGIEVLPMDARRRLLALWETAMAVAEQEGYSLDPVKDPLLNLLQARIVLVTNDDQLKTAGKAVVTLVSTMIRKARDRQFRTLNEFVFTEALFSLRRLYPLTD